MKSKKFAAIKKLKDEKERKVVKDLMKVGVLPDLESSK